MPRAPEVTSSARCWFKFDLRLLRSEIPDVVGDCLENERVNPENGDTLQRTTGGLLVWRKADKATAFTDGSRTWARGPTGVQVRNNDERFPWESEPTAVPKPAPGAPAASPGGAAAAPPTPQRIVVAGDGAAPPPPTSTPVPPKPAPPPTATPPAKPTVDVVKEIMDAAIVGSLRQSGLPLSAVQALTPDNDPDKLLGKGGQYASKITFKDQRSKLGDGAIEVFADDAALKARMAVLEAQGKSDPSRAQHVFFAAASKSLIRLPKDLTPDQAKGYQTWLQTAKF
jgi:hypothetical protein